MYLQLQPGLLSNTPKTEPADQCHKLVINHSIVPLSPKEYALATALLRQRVLWRETGGQTLLCLSVGQLMQATGIQPLGALVRHLSNASMKLAPQGIYLVNLRTYGYIALFEAEVAGSFLAFSTAEDLPHHHDEGDSSHSPAMPSAGWTCSARQKGDVGAQTQQVRDAGAKSGDA